MKSQNKSLITVQILNIVAFTAVFITNSLAGAVGLNGLTTGAVSDLQPSTFTPAGYTFSIWGLIYSALLGFIVYQALPASRKRPFLPKIGLFFVASSIANIAWLFAWHYGYFTWSVLFMVSLLISLVSIYVRLGIGNHQPQLPLATRLLVHFPFSLYLGWITVATIANVASVLNYLGWNGLGIAETTWTVIMISVAVVVAGLLLLNRRNLPYAGVLVWALFGIRTAQIDVPLIANTTIIAAVLITALALLGYWRTRSLSTSSALPDVVMSNQ